jgi:hypothetical protein
MASLQELLSPQVIFEYVINQIKTPGDALQRFWGMQMGGSNTERVRFNYGSYDIFNSTRSPAQGRAPYAPAATLPAQAVGQMPVQLARSFEKIPLFYHLLSALRPLGKPSSDIDDGGRAYLTRQETILKERQQLFREFLVAGMMRGACYFVISGDTWLPTFTSTGATFKVSQQIPSASTGNINGIITTLWSDTTNATIFQNILDINAYFWQLHGYPLKHIWCNSKIWGYITGNADMKARAGTSNIVFETYKRVPDASDMKEARDEFIGVLRPLPEFTFHIYDGGITLGGANVSDGTFTKFFPDTGAASAVFCADPMPQIAGMLEGTEWVAENETTPPVERELPYFYPQYCREPAKIELMSLDVAMPVLRIPTAIAVGTVA